MQQAKDAVRAVKMGRKMEGPESPVAGSLRGVSWKQEKSPRGA